MSRVNRRFAYGAVTLPPSHSNPFFAANARFWNPLPANPVLYPGPNGNTQAAAMRFANQMNWGNPNYSYDGSAAPKFYGYSGVGCGPYAYGFQQIINYYQYNWPVWTVPASQPKHAVTVLGGLGQPGNIQSFCNAVPVPTGIAELGGVGGDHSAVIWSPQTDEMWEFWQFYGTGAVDGSGFTTQGAAYLSNCSASQGMFPNTWGVHATGTIALVNGMISFQDLDDVAAGLPITHALGLTSACNGYPSSFSPTVPPSTASTWWPATRYDTTDNPQTTILAGLPGAGGANPAHGQADAACEAMLFQMDPAKGDPDAIMPGAHPLAKAIYRAMRDYGGYVLDGSGVAGLVIEANGTVGTSYSREGRTILPAYMTDGTKLSGPGNVLTQIPWQNLRSLVLEAF